MNNFTATNAPIADCNPGSVVQSQAQVAAATAADAGTYHVVFTITDPSGASHDEAILYNQSITTTPQSFSSSYTLPANAASGVYQSAVSVRATGTWTWQNVTQTSAKFNVPAPASLSKISGDDQGCAINRNLGQPMTVSLLNNLGQPIVGATVNWSATNGTLSSATSLTDTAGNASILFTAGPVPQKSTITAQSNGVSVTFTQNIHIPLYGNSTKTYRLKPAGNGDPLAGGGFLPDTGESFTLIAGLCDEFNQTALDTTKWFTRYIYNNGTLDYLNDECERFTDNNTHVMTGNSLQLTARARPGTVGHAPSSTGITYLLYDSGMIRSKTTFKYGYFEARIKMPSGLGVWPAFWINPQVGWPPEIDIFEFVRNDATEFPNMIHGGVHGPNPNLLYEDVNHNAQWGYWKAPSPLASDYFVADFHVFSCFWNQDNTVTMFIDGNPIASFNSGWLHNDGSDGGMAHLLIDLAMGGSWPTANWTTPIATNDQVLEVDYVRVYQKAGSILTGVSPF